MQNNLFQGNSQSQQQNKLDQGKEEIKQNFAQAANSLTSLFKSTIQMQDEAYKQGQQDAMKEIIEHCTLVSNGNLEQINAQEMVEFLQNKIAILKNQQPTTNNSHNANNNTNSNIHNNYSPQQQPQQQQQQQPNGQNQFNPQFVNNNNYFQQNNGNRNI